MSYPATDFASAVGLTITASNQLHEIVNGDAEDLISTDSGEIPSLRRVLKDNFYFAAPIDWVVGEDETSFNQLRKFTDGTIWSAPTATSGSPVEMTSDPYSNAAWEWSVFNAEGSEVVLQPRQTGDGVQTVFEAPNTEATTSANLFTVTKDGLRQRPETDYQVTGVGEITFTEAPEDGVEVDILYIKAVLRELSLAADTNLTQGFVTPTGYTIDRLGDSIGTTKDEVRSTGSQCLNVKIWPEESPLISAEVGDTGLVEVGGLRNALNDTIYFTSKLVSGEIQSLDFSGLTATVGGEVVKLFKRDSQIFAHDYISDYTNPTDSELDYLMSCGRTVVWRGDENDFVEINVGKTINLQGNTFWTTEVPFTVSLVSNHTGYLHNTAGNTGFCGMDGFILDGNNIAESISQFSNCESIIFKNIKAKNINDQSGRVNKGEYSSGSINLTYYLDYVTNSQGAAYYPRSVPYSTDPSSYPDPSDDPNLKSLNYRGAFIFVSCKDVDYDNLFAENIQQDIPPALSHGQFQTVSLNDVSNVNGGNVFAQNVDKLFHTTGTSTGNAGTLSGRNINDNVAYFLGTPERLIVSLIADTYQEAIVYNTSSNNCSVSIPSCLVKNGSSRVVTLRSGGGLSVGTLVSENSRTGISDLNYDGVVNCKFENVTISGVSVERALHLVNSEVTIDSLSLKDVDSSDFNEVARIEYNSNLVIGSVNDSGGSAATCFRFQEIVNGNVNISCLNTDKVPTVYLAGQDFGGKVTVSKINGFIIEGNAPSPLTVSNGTIVVKGSYHKVDTEGSANIDELDTILGAPSSGAILTLQTQSNVRDIVLKHGTGNLYLPAASDIRLNSSYDRIRLRWDGTNWSPSL